jgi:L-fuconolactonase
MKSTPRIDAHHHIWDLAVRDQPWTAGLPQLHTSFTFDDLRPHLAAHDIDSTLLVQTLAVADETPEFLDFARVEPMIAGVVGWVDLTANDVADQLAALHERPGGDKLVGIRHKVQFEPDPRWLCRKDVRRGLDAVAAAGLVYELLVTPTQLESTVETVIAAPHVRFVLDHAAKPRIAIGELDPWRTWMAEFGNLDNLAVKLSGLVTEANHTRWTAADLVPYTSALLDVFGAKRVMFGSDWPVCLLAANYDEVIEVAELLTAELSSAEREWVFGGTAVRTYRLGTG